MELEAQTVYFLKSNLYVCYRAASIMEAEAEGKGKTFPAATSLLINKISRSGLVCAFNM